MGVEHQVEMYARLWERPTQSQVQDVLDHLTTHLIETLQNEGYQTRAEAISDHPKSGITNIIYFDRNNHRIVQWAKRLTERSIFGRLNLSIPAHGTRLTGNISHNPHYRPDTEAISSGHFVERRFFEPKAGQGQYVAIGRSITPDEIMSVATDHLILPYQIR